MNVNPVILIDESNYLTLASQREGVMKLLASYFGHNIEIAHTENGAPYIPGINRFISISHCSVAVAVAISNAPVGIDIESLRYLRMQRVASKFIDAVSLDSDIGSPTMLAASWSAKEAVYKLHCGNGFTSHISINYPSASHILTIRHTANYTLAVAVMR